MAISGMRRVLQNEETEHTDTGEEVQWEQITSYTRLTKSSFGDNDAPLVLSFVLQEPALLSQQYKCTFFVHVEMIEHRTLGRFRNLARVNTREVNVYCPRLAWLVEMLNVMLTWDLFTWYSSRTCTSWRSRFLRAAWLASASRLVSGFSSWQSLASI